MDLPNQISVCINVGFFLSDRPAISQSRLRETHIQHYEPRHPSPRLYRRRSSVVVGDSEVVDGGDCFGRADRRNLTVLSSK